MRNAPTDAPLTFDLDEPLHAQAQALAAKHGISVSEVIRQAHENFDAAGFETRPRSHRQVSVRLPAQARESLQSLAKARGASQGELLREALRQLIAKPELMKTPTKKKSAAKKTVAKKSAAKKAATKKTATKKVAAKKSPAKKVAKKATTKKIAKKAAAKKSGAKKATKKAATKKVAKKSTAKKSAAKKTAS